ncbi:MAG TPA: NAD(+) diphosphatase [Thermomicrobiales bacterium]|nr:NAD(+) diphosphatase [Thermomicrobiales bacterium]
MNQPFQPLADANRTPTPEDWCVVVHAGSIILRANGSNTEFPHAADLSLEITQTTFIGLYGERAVYAMASELADPNPGPDLELVPLRAAWQLLGEQTWAIASRAAQVVEWERNHQFCGRCGNPTAKLEHELGRQCPVCSLIAFPRISPATITLIERGNEVLLAHGVHHAPEVYALIAGFVEAGESLEECVVREIDEEIGIAVDRVRYFGSQSWPFPHSIMLGFTAQYVSGEIAVNPAEIEDARWFTIDAMPKIPARMSIARALIDDWARRQGWDPDSL